MNTKPRRQPADGAYSTTHTLTGNDAHILTPNVAQQCVTGAGRPYINTTTPTLKAQVSDNESAAVKAEFSWWVTGGSQIGSAVTTTAPSGSTLQHVVPSGSFANGNNYSWRVRGNDGIVNSAWSSWCEFTVDTVAPSAVPGVSSTTYPEGGWGGGAGTPGTFTMSANGVTDVASYLYGLDANPPTTSVAAATLGGMAAVDITPVTNLPHTLYVQSVDRAGNKSPVRSYQFNVGSSAGTVLLPRTGDMSASKFALQGQGQSGATGVTFQWRRGDVDSWTTIPASDVTYAAGGTAVTWPQPTTGGGAFAKLNWDVAATLNNAEAGSDPLSGPLQVRASYTGAGGSSDQVDVTFDLDRAWASSVGMGPGSVNLLTGNLSVGQTDVAAFDLSLARSFNTRQAGAVDAMFGPGWVSSVTAKADLGYTDLTVTGSLAQIGLPDGAVMGFAKESGTATTAVYAPQVGAEGFALSWTSSPDRFTLTDSNGDVVLFDRPSGGVTGLYVPVSVTPVGSSETTTVSWELVPGSTTAARPTRVLAPVPSGVSCSPTLTAGCRALTFTYATSTTATGTGASEWGDYYGRVVKAEFMAWDPDAGPAAMRTVEMAHYLYDSNGRLRAAWDPRLDWLDTSELPPVNRQVRTVYDYDSNGVMTNLTPPAQEPWGFSYTTVPGDSGLGRLAAVTRSALTAGTAVSTVVYRVPVSGAGAPYDMSGGQTVRWGQSEPPTDGVAVFPPTQIPTGNQSTGQMPSSYERATVTYLDPNGRTVNTADPSGAVATSWYDIYGNVIRTLTPGGRKRALDHAPADSAALEAQLAEAWSSVQTYSDDGLRLEASLGPTHSVALSTGDVVEGRTHIVHTYDEGAPAGEPYNLVTTTETSVRYTGAGGTPMNADVRGATIEYDWDLRSPIAQIIDPNGLALTTRMTYYDDGLNDGKVHRITTPAGGTSTNTLSTQRTHYYRAGVGSGVSDCDNHPEWAGLVCRVEPGGQAATGPELPVKLTTYDLYGQTRIMVEKTSAGTLRTTTTEYEDGHPVTFEVTTGTGLGTGVPKTRMIYDSQTGIEVRTQSLNASDAVVAEIVRVYDTLGRLISYTDADGVVSTTTYDVASRVHIHNDGQATRTYTYDDGDERRGLPTTVIDTDAGTITAAYDADGNVTHQMWANALTVTTEYDTLGAATGNTYTQNACGQPDCTLHLESKVVNAHGQWARQTSSLFDRTFGYDASGRLTTVEDDNRDTGCMVRSYGFAGGAGVAGNRTSLTVYDPDTNGACQTATPASNRAYTYDTADRIITAGTQYDALGRTATVPASDTLGPSEGSVAITYYANDLAYSISQGSHSSTYQLDVVSERFRSWTRVDGGTTVNKVHHYADDTDHPSWTSESATSWTRGVAGAHDGGLVAISSSTGTNWQLTNLHGDIVAIVPDGSIGPSDVLVTDEFGAPSSAAVVGTNRYAWLGAYERAADTPSGLTVMGVRLYNAATGRFLSTDPVYGGSANQYDYCSGDPVNCVDIGGRYGYHFSYRLGWAPWFSPAQIFNRIRNRFWLFFPIPSNCLILYAGRRCNLSGNPVYVEAMWSTGFRFLSLPGHSEGAGKRIDFWFTRSWGTHYLNVRAWGPDVTWCDKQSWCARANRLAAYGLWLIFALRIKLYWGFG